MIAQWTEMRGSRIAIYLTRKLRALCRTFVDQTYRYQVLARLGIVRGGFQIDTTTFENRYPEIFEYTRSVLGAECQGSILSFGCATGEEVFALKTYFPIARIKGVDFNPGNIAECRRRHAAKGDSGLSFQVARSTDREPDCAYDAIFCMAVLRDGSLSRTDIDHCDHRIRFDLFASVIADFERCLKPGGLLAVRHSNFLVAHTPSADKFDAALVSPVAVRTPVFGPDNRLIKGLRNDEAVFRKR